MKLVTTHSIKMFAFVFALSANALSCSGKDVNPSAGITDERKPGSVEVLGYEAVEENGPWSGWQLVSATFKGEPITGEQRALRARQAQRQIAGIYENNVEPLGVSVSFWVVMTTLLAWLVAAFFYHHHYRRRPSAQISRHQ